MVQAVQKYLRIITTYKSGLFLGVFVFGVLLWGGCASESKKQPLRVAAAGNISFVAEAIKKDFAEKHPDLQVEFSFASSGKLTAQIMNGAPFDVFLSADMGYPERLYQEGLTTASPEVYATGKLAIFSAGKIRVKPEIDFVLDPEIKIIAIANPKLATYGTAAAEALTKSGLYEKVKSKFVIGENIFQTVQYSLSAADMGFIAESALYTPSLEKFRSDSTNWWLVPDSLYQPIQQGVVLMKKSADNQSAKTFISYIKSQGARNIFKQNGYHYD